MTPTLGGSLLRLESEVLTATVDAARGGRIVSLVARASRRELLFQAPWPRADPPSPPAGDDAWTRAWPGGWDVLFPNAGAACVVNGRPRGFHGEASLGAWDVERTDELAAELSWHDDDGLRLRRAVRLDGARLLVENAVVNDGERAQPFVLAEHLIFGPAIAAGAQLAVERAVAVQLEDAGHAVGSPAAWPHVRRSGVDENWSSATGEPFSRFGVLSEVAGSRIRAESRDGHAVEVVWRNMPYLWLWHEHGASDTFPGGSPIVCLGLEPALASTSEGLAAALHGDDAVRLEPGDVWRSQTSVCVTTPPA